MTKAMIMPVKPYPKLKIAPVLMLLIRPAVPNTAKVIPTTLRGSFLRATLIKDSFSKEASCLLIRYPPIKIKIPVITKATEAIVPILRDSKAPVASNSWNPTKTVVPAKEPMVAQVLLVVSLKLFR